MTHCGWGSVVEGLAYGQPLITLPFVTDQGLNSRVIVEEGLGVEIPRTEKDGSYTRDSVANSIKMVVSELKGKGIREKAKDMGVLFRDEQMQNRYVDDLVKFLQDHKSTHCLKKPA